VVKLHIY